MHSSLFKFTLALNSVLLFWKLLVFEFVPGLAECFLCSVSSKSCLSARFQLLIETTYIRVFETKTVLTCFITLLSYVLNINCIQDECMYCMYNFFSSIAAYVGLIAQIE
jgi:hypothetical protein